MSLSPIRVLLVFDSPVQRDLGRAILSLTGDMEPRTAADGLEALELVRSFQPDVVVADSVLPVISGLELLRRCRAEGLPARFLVTVTSHRAPVRAAAFAAGADLVLLAPAQWGELLRHIRFLAGGLARPCRELLLDMGAPKDWAGLDQSAFCAGALGERPGVLLKELYLDAARRYGTDPACVEVNIRRLIARLHREDAPAYHSLGLPAGKKPPANKDFLTALARAVKIPL